jgi:hypothetical protein
MDEARRPLHREPRRQLFEGEALGEEMEERLRRAVEH